MDKKEKDIIKWSQRIFLNQAKLGEIMALHEGQEQESDRDFKDCLKNGVRIHKRHREIIQEYAKEFGLADIDDEVNVNNNIIEKFRIKRLSGLNEEQEVVLDAVYDSMKACDQFILENKDLSQDVIDQCKHLRTGYLSFIDDLMDFRDNQSKK